MKELTLRVPFSPNEPDYLDGDDARIMHLFRIFFSETTEGSVTSRIGMGLLHYQFDKMDAADITELETELISIVSMMIPQFSNVNISVRPIVNATNASIDLVIVVTFSTSQQSAADVMARDFFGATFVNNGEQIEKTYKFLLTLSDSTSLNVSIYSNN